MQGEGVPGQRRVRNLRARAAALRRARATVVGEENDEGGEGMHVHVKKENYCMMIIHFDLKMWKEMESSHSKKLVPKSSVKSKKRQRRRLLEKYVSFMYHLTV